MTLDTYLFRPDNKTAFELGSGSWSVCLPLVSDGPVGDPATPTEQFLFDVPTKDRWIEWIVAAGVTAGDLNDQYLHEVAERLTRFCNGATKLWACHDSGDRYAEAFEEGYRLAGSRYAQQVGDWWLEMFCEPSWLERPHSPIYTIYAWNRGRSLVITRAFERTDAYQYWHHVTEAELEHRMKES